MRLKAVTGIVLTVLLTGMLTLSIKVHRAKASGTIYIRADGSVEPPTANISTVDNVTYTFFGNINDSIVVERDNIVVDGAGYALQGTGFKGIDLGGRSNVTIKNMEVKSFGYGIWLLWSSNNILRDNSIANSEYNFRVDVYSLSDIVNDIDTSNTLDGKPIYYWINKRDRVVPHDAGYVALVNCTSITVQSLSLTNNWQGVLLAFTTNSTITNNNIANNWGGICLSFSSNYNSISGNNITNNNDYGIWICESSNNTIHGNTITDHAHSICLQDSSNNTISGNDITNNWSRGIQLHKSSSNTISGNDITNNCHGVSLSESSTNTISENNLTNNDGIGIYLQPSSNNNSICENDITANNDYGILGDSSNNNSISGNNITNNDYGICLGDSSNNNTISGNDIIANNRYGIWLGSSSNNILRNNSMANNKYNFILGGHSLSDFVNDVDTSNMVEGKPIYYWIDERDRVVPHDAGYVALVNSANITVKELELKNNGQGILLANVSKSRITNNTIKNNDLGVLYLYSNYNTISGNDITNNTYGILHKHSSSNSIFGNNITASSSDGIHLSYSSNNTIHGNNITNNHPGIHLYTSSNNTISGNDITANNETGIYLKKSSNNNTISRNTVTNNNYGIWLRSWYGRCNYNIIYANNITNNSFGIYITACYDNLIYHNNFIDNTHQVNISHSSFANFWDNGYPSGGNYWSDYTGDDIYFGHDQNKTGRDGIGDTPYVIAENNWDNYPLIDPWIGLYVYVTRFNLQEESSSNSTLFETILVSNGTMQNATISGDFSGFLNYTSLVGFEIQTGSFANLGCMRGNWTAKVGNMTLEGTWKTFQFFDASNGSFVLKGAVSGDFEGIANGSIVESVPGSDVYDQFHSIWRLNRVGSKFVSATIELNGTITYQNSSAFPSTELYVYQATINGSAAGYCSGPLSTFLIHLRVADENNPYYGEGFSIISYTSDSGSGEGWTYNKLVVPGRVKMNGQFTDPLLGVVSGTLNETTSPRTLFITIERIDFGPSPMVDLKVKTWSSNIARVGRTLDFSIKYWNDGLTSANMVVVDRLPFEVEYVSNSGGGIYDEATHEVTWRFENVTPGSVGLLSVEGFVAEYGTFENIVSIPKEEIEIEIDPKAEIDYELVEVLGENHLRVSIVVSNQTESETMDAEIKVEEVDQEIEPIFEQRITSEGEIDFYGNFTVEGSSLKQVMYTVKSGLVAINIIKAIEEYEEDTRAWKKDQDLLDLLLTNGKIDNNFYDHFSGANEAKTKIGLVIDVMSFFSEYCTIDLSTIKGPAKNLAKKIYDRNFYLSYVATYKRNPYDDIKEKLMEISHDVSSSQIRVVRSLSPEDKYGPIGFDHPNTPPEESERFVSANQSFRYLVDFWNMENASAPAQDVFIKDQLDSNLNWTSFKFEEFGFLDHVVVLEPWQQYFDTDYFNINVDARPEMNLIVNVEGTFDSETGEIVWTFRSLDPETMETPEDPMAGFLPPITESGREIGWVIFSVEPQPGLSTGTQISNEAFVKFDVGPWKPAPKEGPFVNTIDATPPVSSITDALLEGNEIRLNWTANDEGSGIKYIRIYVSEDGMPYIPWLSYTIDNCTVVFTGEAGHTYSFYSIARDNVGNLEETPSEPDVVVSIPNAPVGGIWRPVDVTLMLY